MESHWSWLSRGKESMKWDIVEVTLPESLNIRSCNSSADCAAGETCQSVEDTDGAGNRRSWNQCEPFSWWGDFRQQVVDATIAELNRAGTPVSRYDFDNDGYIDAIWSVVADNGVPMATTVGGASRHRGGWVFVDGQSSRSITEQSYGNFNHEFGHCRGLPDLYGTYSTVSNMTLMANSWPKPSHDFDAYSRAQLGWASPRVLTQSASGVRLVSANQAFDVVRIPTSSASEYFLIEYRVTPSEGYGSKSSLLNGLVVYHVMANSDQKTNPPLLKVEPADGVLAFDTTADQTDALTPTSVTTERPFVAKTHAGSEVFRITAVRSEGSAMSFDISVAP
jgi:M6 family metalloprotease-like protein